MKDKDKLFFIVYFGTNNLRSHDYNMHAILSLRNSLETTFDETVKIFVVPQLTSDEVKFEVLNVEKCSNEKIDDIIQKYESILNQMKNEET